MMYIHCKGNNNLRKVDLSTGFINGSSGWIFRGLHHVRKNQFIPREKNYP